MENIGIQTNTSSNLAGAVAPKTETQAAERSAQRIIKTDNTSLKNSERDQEASRFSAIKDAADQIAKRSNEEEELPPRRYTIYKDNGTYMYVTRFTDVDSGQVEVLREWELVQNTNQSNGSILNGLA